jgi:hypothetical protein
VNVDCFNCATSDCVSCGQKFVTEYGTPVNDGYRDTFSLIEDAAATTAPNMTLPSVAASPGASVSGDDNVSIGADADVEVCHRGGRFSYRLPWLFEI